MLKSGPENIPEYICQQKKFTDLAFDLNTSTLKTEIFDWLYNNTYVQRWGKGEFFPSNGTVRYGGNSTQRGGGNLTNLMLGAT